MGADGFACFLVICVNWLLKAVIEALYYCLYNDYDKTQVDNIKSHG